MALASLSAATLRSEFRLWIPVSSLGGAKPCLPANQLGFADGMELDGEPHAGELLGFQMKRIIFLNDY